RQHMELKIDGKHILPQHDHASSFGRVSSEMDVVSTVALDASYGSIRSPDLSTLDTSLLLTVALARPVIAKVMSDVELDLHKLKEQRIKDYDQAVYIAPMAKPSN
ncbi:hypothetical protein BG015_001880, partial [Linnemannia schmuckeri]